MRDQPQLEVRPGRVVQVERHIGHMAAGAQPLRHALFDLDRLRLITLQHLHALLPQHRRKAIGTGINAASHIDDALRLIGKGVEEDRVVIPCSRIEVIVKGLRPKPRNLAGSQPDAVPPPEEWQELPHEMIGVLEFAGFVHRLDIARFRDAQRVAESRIRPRDLFDEGVEKSRLTRSLSDQGFNGHSSHIPLLLFWPTCQDN